MKRSPTSPSSAHHRLIGDIIKTHFEEDISPTPEEISKVSRVFKKAGGRWEKLFKGSIDDMTLLKKVIKVAIKKGILSESPTW